MTPPLAHRVRRSSAMLITMLFSGLLIVGCTSGDLEAENPPPPAPTGPVVSAVSEWVSGTYTGTHTIELGEPPEDATHVRTDLTCLSPGTLTLDDGSIIICPTTSAATSSMTSYEILPGRDSVTVTADEASTKYTVSAVYEDGASVR
jgi:hypothetical protein